MEEKKNFSNLEKRLSLGTINFDELSLKFNSDEKTKSTFLSQRSSIIDTSFNSAVMNNISDEKNKFSLQKGSSLGLIKFDNPQNQMQFLINLTPVREIFNKILNISIEEYIFHTKVFLEYDEDQAFIFITKQTLFFTYIFLDEKDNLKSYKEITDKIILFRIDYKKIYEMDVFIDENYGNSIKLEVVEGSEGVKHSEMYLISYNRKFKCLYFKESFIVHHLIKKYITISWQIFFESNILMNYNSQFYQSHFFVKKINRWGNNQDRLLILSNKFMFNAAWLYKNYTYKIEKLKWADSLRSITKIVLNERKNLEMKIYYDSKINKIETSSEKIKEKSKDSRGFLFISLKDKQLFISNIRRIYFNLSNSHLNIESSK